MNLKLFQDSDSGQIKISATGIFAIVLGAAVAIGSLIFGIWWSKFRGTHIYPVDDDDSVELRPLNQPDPDETDAPPQPPAQQSTQSRPEESQGQPQPQSGEPQGQPQSQSGEPQGQNQSDENPFELEG